MSDKRPDTREELELLIKSGWQLIALESFEERRALRILGTVAKTCERELICWSVASGLENGSGAGSLDEGLLAMASHVGPALFVVLDAHRVMEDPIAIRRLRDLLSVFAERRQTLVLLGPAIELQIELEQLILRKQV